MPLYIWRIFHGDEKIWILCSSGKNNISRVSLAISEDFPNLFRRPDERSRTFSEDFRRLPEISEEDPKMFRWYTNKFKYNLRDKLDSSEIIDFFTCEDIISSDVKISYRFYQFVTIRYTTDCYIIKALLYCLENYRKPTLLASFHLTSRILKYSTLYITDSPVVRV